LYWKRELEDGLSAAEEQELAALERENMKIIGEVYEALKDDKEVREWMEMIKGHEWVKMVEG